jgi:hypothetical protein
MNSLGGDGLMQKSYTRGGLFLIIMAFGDLGKLMQHHYFGVQKNAYTTNHLIGVVKFSDIEITR